MKLPNKVKVGWWGFLLLLVGYLLYTQLKFIKNGESSNISIFIFLIFIILLLLPLFSEFEFFGIKLKKDIEDLKKETNAKFENIKNEIRNTQSQAVTNNFQGYGPPPSNEEIENLKKDIQKLKDEQNSSINDSDISSISPRISVPQNNIMMFKIRFNIENEIKRLWQQKFQFQDNRYQPVTKMLNDLSKHEVIQKNLHRILREILSICNIGIHGDNLTDYQIDFALKQSKEVIDYLKSL